MNNENKHSRLVIISNRLPFEIEMKEDILSIRPGRGGLVTALAPVLRNRGGIWIGTTGQVDGDETKLRTLVKDESKKSGYQFAPVFLTKEEIDLYYHGFSNEILWPLFHELLAQCNFLPSYWQAYQDVNAKFADTVLENTHPQDFIWVHDYHLMLLGQELRKKGCRSKIGFFLHIPFPPLAIFLKLPWRFRLINALLEFDLVGFQTMRDRRNFIQCVRALAPDVKVAHQHAFHLCKKGDAEIRVGTFPISIDYNEFTNKAASKEISEKAWLLHEKWPNQRIVLSIDRLDYTKGIPQRLEAIRIFLKQYPEYHQKVCFFQAVVPSRVDIPEYQQLKREIDRLVGEINSQFTHENWVPVHHVFRSLSKEELLSYYRTSDIVMVSPIQDGMNLVCKEYIACNIEENGVLVLSEFAGAAAQLHHYALLINPFDVVGVAQALNTALTMPEKDRKKRMRKLRLSVKRYDIMWWMRAYLNAAFGKDLQDFVDVQEFIPTNPEEEGPRRQE